MKITKFEESITVGAAETLLFLDRMISAGDEDPEVTPSMLVAAIRLKDEVAGSIEDYAGSVLEEHGIKD